MKKVILITSALALSACTQGDLKAANANMRQGVTHVSNSVHDYFNPPPVKKKEMPPTYCYRTLTDVLCYDTPQPDKQEKLVGKQVPSNLSDQALTGGDPNVGVIDMKPVPSAPVPPISSTSIMPPPSPPTPPAPGSMEPGPPPAGENGQQPHALMPQF